MVVSGFTGDWRNQISRSALRFQDYIHIVFTNDSSRFTPMTTYQEPAIVKKHCVTNLFGKRKLMAGFYGSLSKPTTIFCDFDGPIVDVSDRYYNTYQRALTDTAEFYRELLTSPLQECSFARKLSPLTKAQFWQMKQDRIADREIARLSGMEGDEIDYFLDRVIEIVNRADLLQYDKIQPGVTWALGLLKSQGCRLILVTLRDRDEAINILETHGLMQLFTDIYGTSNSEAAYQNYSEVKTQLLKRAMRQHQVTERHLPRAWMIGDTEADVLAGQTMGIATIALTCGIRSEAELLKLDPTLIKADLLCATHHLVGVNSRQPCGSAN
jgi:phosphoglycolate phosphatase